FTQARLAVAIDSPSSHHRLGYRLMISGPAIIAGQRKCESKPGKERRGGDCANPVIPQDLALGGEFRQRPDTIEPRESVQVAQATRNLRWEHTLRSHSV